MNREQHRSIVQLEARVQKLESDKGRLIEYIEKSVALVQTISDLTPAISFVDPLLSAHAGVRDEEDDIIEVLSSGESRSTQAEEEEDPTYVPGVDEDVEDQLIGPL